MDQKQIIMNFSVPPGLDDIAVMAKEILESFPEELVEFCEDVVIEVEDMPDEVTEQDLDLEDPYELILLYKNGKQVSPGIEKKVANDDDVLVIFRRPLLDMWCETGEDLAAVLRQAMIEEIGSVHDFSDEEIDEMTSRHYQGML